ncbi:MAG: Gfo/Idh/MocA family oxidoreductase [Fuerstiella sp.]|nr:Gfo/Idh/MocA family oxidoreductase [Fuerstiella sp.]
MSQTSPNSRRCFLKSSALTSATLSTPLFVHAEVHGRVGGTPASEQIRVGVIGTGNRARQLMRQLPAPGKLVAISDCYMRQMLDAEKTVQTEFPKYTDYREMLDREQLDAVIIGTPDHGRSLACIRACQAGLDVYAEKPLTAYIQEGREVVKAVRRHNRVFQVGTQQRTMELNRFCCKLVRKGGLGDIKLVQALNYTGPIKYPGVGKIPEEPVPHGNNWDMWCGPTELRPFSRHLQFRWMQWWDYSGGEMTNWGAHGVDQIQSALGKSLTGPRELWPETPGTNGRVSMKYADGILVRFELKRGPKGGAVFVGTRAKMEINRNRFATNPADFVTGAPDPDEQKKWDTSDWMAGPHLANWLTCIKTREKPNADVEIGHRSISVCHLVNITRELGRKLIWDADTEQFENDDEANTFLSRPRRAGYELPVG